MERGNEETKKRLSEDRKKMIKERADGGHEEEGNEERRTGRGRREG